MYIHVDKILMVNWDMMVKQQHVNHHKLYTSKVAKVSAGYYHSGALIEDSVYVGLWK